jgi:hypothetical protein
VTRENRIKGDRDAAWKADLASMRMSAKQHVKIGMGCLLIDFRRV